MRSDWDYETWKRNRDSQKDIVDKTEAITYDYIVNKQQLKCLRCGWEWPQKGKKPPIQCVKCKSPYWNKPKR